jgi:hypothetical protein
LFRACQVTQVPKVPPARSGGGWRDPRAVRAGEVLLGSPAPDAPALEADDPAPQAPEVTQALR